MWASRCNVSVTTHCYVHVRCDLMAFSTFLQMSDYMFMVNSLANFLNQSGPIVSIEHQIPASLVFYNTPLEYLLVIRHVKHVCFVLLLTLSIVTD